MTLYQIVDSNNDPHSVGFDGNAFASASEAEQAIRELPDEWTDGLRVVELPEAEAKVRPMGRALLGERA